MRISTVVAIAAIASVLTACGGSGHAGLIAPMDAAKGTATLKIVVPKNIATNARKPNYVSPATTQLSIDIQQSGVSVSGYPQTVGLTPTSTGCTSTLANTLCELTISLAPGSFTATLTAMDASNNALSTAQSIAFTITPGTNNTISLTLSGVPKEIQVLPLDNVTTPGSGAQSYTLLGAGAHRFLAVALDADGNTIIGPGAPSFSASISGFTGTIAQPTTARPNIFTVTPPSTFDTATGSVAVTASYAGQATDGCAQSGAVCSANIGVNMKELIAMPGPNTTASVDLYEEGQTTKILTITTANIATSAAFDSSGNLFVGEEPGIIQEFSPPFSAGMAATASVTPTTPSSSYYVAQLVPDNSGHLYASIAYRYSVSGVSHIGHVADKLPVPLGSGTTLMTDPLGSNTIGLASDGSGNVFAAPDDAAVEEFSPNGTSQSLSNVSSNNYLAAVAPDSTLAVYDGTSVRLYASPYTAAPVTLTPSSQAFSLAFASNGDLYVGEYTSASASIIEGYAAPYTSSAFVSTTIGNLPEALVSTQQNELFVHMRTTSMGQYALPLTSSSTTAATYSANGAAAVAP